MNDYTYTCQCCLNGYTYRSGWTTKEYCSTCRQRIRRIQCKLKAVEYKGGKCVVCGYNTCVAALDFHHMNRSEKKFEINEASKYTWNTVQKELDKCVLLCATHHRELEAGVITVC